MAFIFAHPVAGFSSAADAGKAGIVADTGYGVADGRFGLGAFNNTDSATSVVKAFPVAQDKVVVQFAMAFTSLANATKFCELFNNSGADVCMRLDVTAAGAIRLVDAAGATVVTTAAALVAGNSAYHVFAVEAEIGSGAGTVRVWLDGSLVIDEAGVDLDDGAGTAADMVRWGLDAVASVGHRLSEFFIYDLSGAAPWNAHIGDKRLIPLLPEGDDTVAWTPSGGPPNFDEVDDPLSANSDGDATYVEINGDGTDLYDMEDMPVTPVSGILGVIVNMEARKTGAGAEPGDGLRSQYASTGGNNNSAILGPLTTSYQEYQLLLPDAPGSSGWTEAEINALQLGPHVATPA